MLLSLAEPRSWPGLAGVKGAIPTEEPGWLGWWTSGDALGWSSHSCAPSWSVVLCSVTEGEGC